MSVDQVETKQSVAGEALAAALEIGNEWWRDRALRALVRLVSAEGQQVVLEAARKLPTPGTRARSLARLAAAWPAAEGEALAREALALGERLPSKADRAGVTALLVG